MQVLTPPPEYKIFHATYDQGRFLLLAYADNGVNWCVTDGNEVWNLKPNNQHWWRMFARHPQYGLVVGNILWLENPWDGKELVTWPHPETGVKEWNKLFAPQTHHTRSVNTDQYAVCTGFQAITLLPFLLGPTVAEQYIGKDKTIARNKLVLVRRPFDVRVMNFAHTPSCLYLANDQMTVLATSPKEAYVIDLDD